MAGAPPPAPWFERLDDRLNAVLVKDLRLWARGRMFRAGFLGLVAASAAAAFLYASWARAAGRGGGELWRLAFAAATLVGGGLAPYLVYDGFRRELDGHALELFRLTRLDARRLARGKVLASWCGAAAALAATAPMLAGAYLLGGLSPAAVAWHGAAAVAVCGAAPCVYLFLLSLGTGLLWRVGALVVLCVHVVAVAAFARWTWNGGAPEARPAVAYGLLAVAAGIGRYLYALAVARWRPPTENRDAAVRVELLVWTTAAGAASAAAAAGVMAGGRAVFGWGTRETGMAIHAVASVMTFVFCGGFMLAAMAETRDRRFGRRTARPRCPRDAFFAPGTTRLCAFLLLGTAGLLYAYLPVFAAWRLTAPSGAGGWGTDFRLMQAIAIWPTILAPGLALHALAVEPRLDARRLSAPPVATVVGVQVALALVAVPGAALVESGVLGLGWRPWLYALSPLTWTHVPFREAGPMMGVVGVWLAASYAGLARAAGWAWRGYAAPPVDRKREGGTP